MRISGSSVRVLVRYSGGQEQQLDEVKEELRRRGEEVCSWQRQPHYTDEGRWSYWDIDEGSYWDPDEESYCYWDPDEELYYWDPDEF